MNILKCLVVFTLIVAAHSNARAAEALDALADLETAQPSWLFPGDACPADVMPDHTVDVLYLEDACINSLGPCLNKCKAGNANDCYALALATQSLEKAAVAGVLFLRACSLGIISGCTNRAVGLPEAKRACSVRTFERACAFDDPWACTMFGFHLVRGEGVEKDYEKAREVLAKSCKHGDEEPACGYAKGLLGEIE